MKAITEEDKEVIEGWKSRSKEQTLETLPEFLRELTQDYGHDYGTIVRAMGAGMMATLWAMNRSTCGGITGFQASYVGWEVARELLSLQGPARIMDFHDMLYPQYDRKFAQSITPETWHWLQAEARKNLEERDPHVHRDVVTHWQSIVDGVVPFGYDVKGR